MSVELWEGCHQYLTFSSQMTALLFFWATEQEALVVKGCLKAYAEASGKVVNFHKSNMIFWLNTLDETKVVVDSSILNVVVVVDFEL